jgi:hypothetical protein
MDVAPARLGRVRRLAVEFHGNPELSIAIVEVTSTFASAALRLPEGAWQPVWPFDAPDVPPFQAGSRRGAGRMNRVVDPGGIVHNHGRHAPAALLRSDDNSSRTAHYHVDRIDRPVT